MDSKELAKYIEATDGISKPWLLVQLRLRKLQERRSEISAEEYVNNPAPIGLPIRCGLEKAALTSLSV